MPRCSLEDLLAVLDVRGVTLSVENGELVANPAALVGDRLAAMLGEHYDALVARAHKAPTDCDPSKADDGEALEVGTDLGCCWCGCRDLLEDDDRHGLVCSKCQALAWRDTTTGGLVRADSRPAPSWDSFASKLPRGPTAGDDKLAAMTTSDGPRYDATTSDAP